MPEINLDEWAARHGVAKRTAQRWAKLRLIPAKKKTTTKTIIKPFHGYVIDEDAIKPDLSI